MHSRNFPESPMGRSPRFSSIQTQSLPKLITKSPTVSPTTSPSGNKRKSFKPVRAVPRGYKDVQPGIVLKLGVDAGYILRSIHSFGKTSNGETTVIYDSSSSVGSPTSTTPTTRYSVSKKSEAARSTARPVRANRTRRGTTNSIGTQA